MARHHAKKKTTTRKKAAPSAFLPLSPPRSKAAAVIVYSRPSGYWYAQAHDVTTGAQITDASGYSRENVLRELRGKFAMIGVTIKSITDEDPYVAKHSSPTRRRRRAAQLDREVTEALRRAHATKSGVATVMTAARFNELASRSEETLRTDDFAALLEAVRKLQPRTIIGVRGDYGGIKKIAEGRYIRLAETDLIAAPWSRRAIVEEILPGRQLSGDPQQLDVSPSSLRAVQKTKFKRR